MILHRRLTLNVLAILVDGVYLVVTVVSSRLFRILRVVGWVVVFTHNVHP